MNRLSLLLTLASMLSCATLALAENSPRKLMPRKGTAEVSTPSTAWNEPVTGMEFLPVKGGCFEMGDTFGEGLNDEKPLHKVCVNDFAMGRTEVSVAQFKAFVTATGYKTEAELGDGCFNQAGKVKGANWKNPGFAQTDAHPVVCVSWNDVTAFGSWLSEKSGREVRLPTEAEWEYAARSGGKPNKYAWGSAELNGNLADESLKKRYNNWKVVYKYDDGFTFTAPVGSYTANELGFHDMSGNVWEWCQDWYGKDYYKVSPVENPQGPSDGKLRILRGGAWGYMPSDARTARRNRFEPAGRSNFLGFRLVTVSSK